MKLMDEVRNCMTMQHLSRKTVESYCRWIRDYVRFTGARRRDDLNDTVQIERYITHLATSRRVSASTQNQAFYSVLFLYREILKLEVGGSYRAVHRSRAAVLLVCIPERQRDR